MVPKQRVPFPLAGFWPRKLHYPVKGWMSRNGYTVPRKITAWPDAYKAFVVK